jgi:Flp pilus assembly pilin Flp
MLEYFGYIDPSIFATMFAVIVAGLVTVAASMKIFWARITNKLRK